MDKVKKNKGGRPRVDQPKIHHCDECDYSTTQTTALRNHYLARHASEKERVEKYNFYCHFCKVGFMSPKTMENHKNTIGHKRRVALIPWWAFPLRFVKRYFDTVIYHGDCPDGFTAAWAFWMMWGYTIEYLPYRHGQDPVDVTGRTVAIVDFSFKRQTLIDMASRAKYLVVLDHHMSAQTDLEGLVLSNGEIIFDMERSGAQIAWDYLNSTQRPWVVDYVADRDLWRNVLPQTKEISQALFFDGYFKDFEKLQSTVTDGDSQNILAERGKVLLEYKEQECEYYAKTARPTRMTVGDQVYRVNLTGCPRSYRSDVGSIISNTQDCDFAGVYWYDFESREWLVSLRASNESTFNLSEIAAELPNGGGHPKAAGFTIYTDRGESLDTYFELEK